MEPTNISDTAARREWCFTGPLELYATSAGDRPQVDTAAVDRDRFLRRPLRSHVENVGHDARPRLQLSNELRSQPLVDALEKVERDDARLAEIGGEQGLCGEPHASRDSNRPGSHPGLL